MRPVRKILVLIVARHRTLAKGGCREPADTGLGAGVGVGVRGEMGARVGVGMGAGAGVGGAILLLEASSSINCASGNNYATDPTSSDAIVQVQIIL